MTELELEKMAHEALRGQLISARDAINRALEKEFASSDDDADYIGSALSAASEIYWGWMVGYNDRSIVDFFRETFLVKGLDGYAPIDEAADLAPEVFDLAKALGWKEPE